MAKYCMRCGEKNEDGVSVCKGCGMPLEETPSHNEKVVVKLDVAQLSQSNQLLKENIVEEEICQKDFMYLLSDRAKFSATEYKVLNSAGNKGMLKCKKILFNDRETLYYMTDGLKPFDVVIENLDERRFLNIVEGLFKQINEVRNNGFLLDTGIDIRMKRIYVDMADGSVYLTYLPINIRCYSDPMYLEDDLRKDLSYMIRTMPNLQGSGSKIIEQMLDEPACSFASIMASIRQSLSMSTGTGY